MNTLRLNPYQTTLLTTVKTQRLQGNQTLLTPSDTILADYERLALLPEKVQVEGILLPPENLLPDGSLRYPRNFHRKEVEISVPWEGRRLRQRMVTARILLTLLAQSFFHTDIEFDTIANREEAFTMRLAGSFVPSDVPQLVRLLRRRLLQWSAAGLDIRTNARGETTVFAMASLPWMGPHLFHTSELGDFRLENARIMKDGFSLTFVMLPVHA